MNIVAIIPARMASTRFFGKPLALLHNLPMIAHVALRTQMCSKLNACYVATCDEDIANFCKDHNINTVMTSHSHERCTSRVAEALVHIEKSTNQHIDIVVIVQGDEPMVTANMIDTALDPMLQDPSIQVVNLMANIKNEDEFYDKNTIKVVCDKQGDALYFSRLAIPSTLHGKKPQEFYKQVCIMPFRRNALLHFESLAPTMLEQAESIDMLRLLEHGLKVRMVKTTAISKCVDTAKDLELVSSLMQDDLLMQQYIQKI